MNRISEYLELSRIQTEWQSTSKKRLLKDMANLLATDNKTIHSKEIFHRLTEREKLGSTGIGHGIALPHARAKNIKTPVIAILSLTTNIDFDAIDSKPIQLAVGLLIPENANETHLKLLAELAAFFSDEQLRSKTLASTQANELYSLINNWRGAR